MTKSLKSKLDYGPLRVTFDWRAKEGLLERVLIHNPTNRSSRILLTTSVNFYHVQRCCLPYFWQKRWQTKLAKVCVYKKFQIASTTKIWPTLTGKCPMVHLHFFVIIHSHMDGIVSKVTQGQKCLRHALLLTNVVPMPLAGLTVLIRQ